MRALLPCFCSDSLHFELAHFLSCTVVDYHGLFDVFKNNPRANEHSKVKQCVNDIKIKRIGRNACF